MTITNLYICEKPSQARDIAKILGCNEKQDGCLKNQSTVVTWCFGHLSETASPDFYCENIKPWCVDKLPIIPDTWKMIVKKESSKQATVIKNLLKQTDQVIIATDADREGEVIARELLDLFKFKGNIKRLWLSALDDASIQKALANIRDGNTTKNLYYAGLGRQRADWLIGMNITMAASVLYGKYGEGVLSVGRVQTPTLKLVVDRDYIIENFKSKEHYEIEATFLTKDKNQFTAKWQPKEELTDEENRLVNIDIAKKIMAKINNQLAIVEKYEEKKKHQSSPLCLSLSALQKLASSKFNLSAKETLDIAQSLYETHKAITYPRTDCPYLPESQFHEAGSILNNLTKTFSECGNFIKECDLKFKSTVWNDKKITAHHAMVPTFNKNVKVAQMDPNELKIYGLICRYYIAQFLGNFDFNEVSVSLNVKDEIFKKTCQTPLNLGWKKILQNVTDEDENKDEASVIPPLTKDEVLQTIDPEILTKHTKPPYRFTEGTLIEAMKQVAKYVNDDHYKKILKETAGIGTEATRASIIETLFKRGYLEKKNKQIIATEKGKKLISVLPPIVSNPALTAMWEQELDLIAEGNSDLTNFITKQKEVVKDILHELNQSEAGCKNTQRKSSNEAASNHICPACNKKLIMRQSSKDKKHFWGCSNYPICRFTAVDQNGSPVFTNTKGSQNAVNPK